MRKSAPTEDVERTLVAFINKANIFCVAMNNVTDGNSNQHKEVYNAGALICPKCCVEYVEIEFDFEFNGTVLHNVKALKCPSCKEEIFTPEQYDVITSRIKEKTEI